MGTVGRPLRSWRQRGLTVFFLILSRSSVGPSSSSDSLSSFPDVEPSDSDSCSSRAACFSLLLDLLSSSTWRCLPLALADLAGCVAILCRVSVARNWGDVVRTSGGIPVCRTKQVSMLNQDHDLPGPALIFRVLQICSGAAARRTDRGRRASQPIL